MPDPIGTALAGATPPGAGATPPPAPPVSPDRAGMAAAPADAKGEKETAKANLQIVMKMLEQSLIAFGSDTDDGKAIMNSLKTLSNRFSTSDKQEDIVPSQLMNMMGALPDSMKGPAQGASPELMKMLGGGA